VLNVLSHMLQDRMIDPF